MRKRNKIKQLCCGTVNPINACSWKVFQELLRRKLAIDSDAYVTLCVCYYDVRSCAQMLSMLLTIPKLFAVSCDKALCV